jgi:GT2 family glycosyltransferase
VTRATAYSVVVPARDAAPFLAETVASVRAQSVPPAEIVVVDDASTDGTGDLARSLGTTVVAHDTARGAARSRNAGIVRTRTPLVAFLDADDLWRADHAARLLQFFASPRTVLACSGHERFGAMTGRADLSALAGVHADFADRLWEGNPISQSSVIARRECLVAVGGYDESLRVSEDYEMWFRVAQLGDVAVSPEPTLLRRIHASQLSKSTTFLSDAWRVRATKAEQQLAVAGEARRRRIVDALQRAAANDRSFALWTADPRIVAELRAALAGFDAAVPGVGLARTVGEGSSLHRLALDAELMVRRIKRHLLREPAPTW